MLDKLIIGTAQFGLDYGVNSSTAKKVTRHDVNDMLDIAVANGIRTLDTAEAYGDAIDKIAHYHSGNSKFEIISKFLDAKDIIKPLTASLKKLSIDSYHTILAHKSQDLFMDSDVQRDLMALKTSGLTKYIGVSIYSNAELKDAINSKYVDVIQLPFNMLDNMAQRGMLMRRAKEAGKILHARSIYLQGMFLKSFPLPPKLKPLEAHIDNLRSIAQTHNTTITGLALGYVFHNTLIDGVVVGHHSSSQLAANIDLIKNLKGTSYIEEIDNLNVKEAELLNPRNW